MIDVKQQENGDIDITTGDIQLTEPTAQHQRDLLVATQGSYKETPIVGVGAINYLNDNERPGFLRSVNKEFSRDGMKVHELKMPGRELIIDAEYNENNNG